MKAAYPIIMTSGERYTVVYIPDFNINTEGTDTADAMEMARDAIGIMGIDMEDDKEPIPEPSVLADVAAAHPGELVTLVDVDFAEYRRRNDMRTVRRNVSLPSWLNAAADKANLNVSARIRSGVLVLRWQRKSPKSSVSHGRVFTMRRSAHKIRRPAGGRNEGRREIHGVRGYPEAGE